MSQKKPTTNQQLEVILQAIGDLEPGRVVTLDRELQQRNTTLMLMLYGAVAKFGIGMQEGGVIVTAQIPVLQVPANQSLQWEVSADGKSVMLYIVLNEDVPAEESSANAPAVEDTAVGEVGATEETPLPASIPEDIPVGAVAKLGDGNTVPEPFEDANDAIGDEFEDEIKVGLGEDDGDDYDGH